MKIAFFHNLPPGGAKRVIYEEVKYFSHGNQVDVYEIFTQGKQFLDLEDWAANIKRYPFEIKSNLPGFLARIEKDWKNFFCLARLHRKIAAEIDKEDYEIVIVHPDKFTQAPFLLRYLKTPAIYYCEEPLRIAYEPMLAFSENVSFLNKFYEEQTRKIRRKIDFNNARSANLLITNSKFTHENARRAYGIKGKLCYPGVDAEVFRPSGHKKKTVLFVGEKESILGFDLVREAFELAKRKDKELELRVNSFSDENFPRLSDEEFAREYSQAMITVCAAFNEPFGLVPLESMACETPVIAVKEGGYQETVTPGLNGFLVERDASQLAEKIIFLAENPQVVEKMGLAGRKNVQKHWSCEKHGKCLEKAILEISKKK